MRNYIKILIIVLLFILAYGCEQDTICIDETTPHLVIRFYDKTDHSKLKKVTNLKVTVENSLEDSIEVVPIVDTDSIAIPLNVDLDYTKIYLSKNTVEETGIGIDDEFTLNYNREDVYVSRSCGYKTIYNNASTSDVTDYWMENISIIFTEVNNENQAHLHIFH